MPFYPFGAFLESYDDFMVLVLVGVVVLGVVVGGFQHLDLVQRHFGTPNKLVQLQLGTARIIPYFCVKDMVFRFRTALMHLGEEIIRSKPPEFSQCVDISEGLV